MSRIALIVAASTLLAPVWVAAQETGTSAQPNGVIYNRMRRFPGQMPQNQQNPQQQPQTAQTQQFPNPQFPPEQQVPMIQRPGMTFPHASAPITQPTPQQAQPPVQTAKPEPSQAPQAPYGLALQPPNPPRISYAGGQLTVDANNSSLGDILEIVGRTTGAHIEGNLPPDSDRVFGQFGPGTVREVLNSLLSGSRFDYILVGATGDPGNIQSIMLTPHGGSLEGVTTAANQPNRPSNVPQQEDEDSNEPAVIPQPAVIEPPPPPAQVTAPTEQTQPGQMQVKTPEQLLQELQRLRQQQQQTQTPR